MTEETPAPALPEGEYAIVEALGHRTLVGRLSEVERFGTKFVCIEPIFRGQLLPPVLLGGGSIYSITQCSAEVALKEAPEEKYQLPPSLAVTISAPALPAPSNVIHFGREDDNDDEGELPDFLTRGD